MNSLDVTEHKGRESLLWRSDSNNAEHKDTCFLGWSVTTAIRNCRIIPRRGKKKWSRHHERYFFQPGKGAAERQMPIFTNRTATREKGHTPAREMAVCAQKRFTQRVISFYILDRNSVDPRQGGRKKSPHPFEQKQNKPTVAIWVGYNA